MPSKNTVKHYEPESMYHVYNRGVDKRIIFVDEKDYAVFLSFLKYALLSDEEIKKNELIDPSSISNSSRFNLRRLGLHGSVELVSYCLMPNHFHLLLWQNDIDGISRFMRSIATGYSVYFNKRHKRVGSLFQGRYKASKIDSDSYWLHVSRYIHLNSVDLGVDYKKYKYSSYPVYVGKAKSKWVSQEKIMGSFKDVNEYEEFCDSYMKDKEALKAVKEILANSGEL